MSARRLWILVCALALAVGLAACGQEIAARRARENDGVYVDAGPITYQLQVSRELNQYAIEDRQYLAGLPAGDGTLDPPTSSGTACSCGPRTRPSQPAADRGHVRHRRHQRATTTTRSRSTPSVNGYAWTPQTLPPIGDRARRRTRPRASGRPRAACCCSSCPTSVYSNRPLTLEIFAAERQGSGHDLARPDGLQRAGGRPAPRSVCPARPAISTSRTAGAAVAPPAPWLGNSAPTTIRGAPDRGVADEPGVGQLVGVRDARAGGGGGVRELGGAGLAGHRDARRSRPRCRSRTRPPRPSSAGPRRRRGRLVTCTNCGRLVGLERRHRAPAAHRDRRRHVGHLERGGLDLALADRRGADREVVADLCWPTGSCSRPRPGSSAAG